MRSETTKLSHHRTNLTMWRFPKWSIPISKQNIYIYNIIVLIQFALPQRMTLQYAVWKKNRVLKPMVFEDPPFQKPFRYPLANCSITMEHKHFIAG
jgi:hypothetical protein